MDKMKFLFAAAALFFSASAYSAETTESAPVTNINENDIIYSIVTDRFYNGDKANDINVRPKSLSSYHGGDFQGIIDKLDYLSELGVTALWISPVTEVNVGAYHGYAPVDFYKVNEHFGDIQKLKELVSRAHAKKIKVILDVVLNHTGIMHPWRSDPSKASWYHSNGSINDWNDQTQLENNSLSNLPDLAQENPAVKKYLIDMSLWWIKETGADGFRLDAVRHVPMDFWKDFSSAIKEQYPTFFTIGEAWNGSPFYVNNYQENGLSGMINFPVHYALTEYLAGTKTAEESAAVIKETMETYSNKNLYGMFIDSHDVSRYISSTPGFTEENLKQALTFLLTYTGIPIVYYGTEFAMTGAGDPNNRKDMEWGKETSVTDYLKKLIALRKKYAAFRSGDFGLLEAKGKVLAYSRSDAENFFAVAFNADKSESAKVKISVPSSYLSKGRDLVNVFDGSDYYQIDEKGFAEVKLKPLSYCVLAPGKGSFAARYSFVGVIVLAALFCAGGIFAVLRLRRRKK